LSKDTEIDRGIQPAAYLATLLEILACPIDPSRPVTPIRDPGGQVVALRSLRSQNGEYPVVNNVPCMMPALLARPDRNLTLWQEHQ